MSDMFREESVSEVYPFIKYLTFGLIKVHRLQMESKRIYAVDVGFNDVHVYDQESSHHREKDFWKVNISDNPPPIVQSIEKGKELTVQVSNIPSFDPQFNNSQSNQVKGTWVNISCTIRVVLGISRDNIKQLQNPNNVNPMKTLTNDLKKPVQSILAYSSYEESLIVTDQQEKEIEEYVQQHPDIQKLGLKVTRIQIEEVQNSKKLAEEMQKSWSAINESHTRKEKALVFEGMDQQLRDLIIDMEATPDKHLENRARMGNLLLQGQLLGNNNLADVIRTNGQAAMDLPPTTIDQPISIPGEVAGQALKKAKDEDWPPLAIPADIPHTERLEWERKQIMERVPHQLEKSEASSDTFTFKLESDHELKIVWWKPEEPPQVLLNGLDKTAEYPALSSSLYDYNDTTVWDIYWETRKQQGLQNTPKIESSDKTISD